MNKIALALALTLATGCNTVATQDIQDTPVIQCSTPYSMVATQDTPQEYTVVDSEDNEYIVYVPNGSDYDVCEVAE